MYINSTQEPFDNSTSLNSSSINSFDLTKTFVKDLTTTWSVVVESKNNVQLSEPILYSYTGPPIKRIDNNIFPNNTSTYIKDKSIINNYNINEDFISALQSNELVNNRFYY